MSDVRLSRVIVGVVAALAVLAAAWHAAATSAQEPAAAACGDPMPGRAIDDVETQMLERLNAYRAGLELPALTPVPALMQAARAKAALGDGLLVHDDPTRTWEERFRDCGHPSTGEIGEILGCETDGPERLVVSWQESPVHGPLLRSATLTAVGIARGRHPSGFQCWVIDLGTMNDA
jgi:uncharacterized protein YkwD